VLRIIGEVDISNARSLSEAIESAVPNDATTVLVDLAQTTYLDSAGVHLLIQLSERLKVRRRELRVVVPEEAPVRAVLELAGLAEVIPLETRPKG
jgi:anti-sigma B factor antagonist